MNVPKPAHTVTGKGIGPLRGRAAAIAVVLAVAGALAPSPTGASAAVGDVQKYTTAGEYSYTVPAGVVGIDVDLYGASGGSGCSIDLPDATAGPLGGSGGRAKAAAVSVQAGDVITVSVGGKGGDCLTGTGGTGDVGAPGAGGFNGGASGGRTSNLIGGGGGGGATTIAVQHGDRRTAMVAAGGGGGGGTASAPENAAGRGGSGGAPAGGDGTAGAANSADQALGGPGGGGGGGGTTSSPGTGGVAGSGRSVADFPCGPAAGTDGSTSAGGRGADACLSGGGGGGGAFGGAGGGGAGFGTLDSEGFYLYAGGGGGGGGSSAGPAGTTFASGIPAPDAPFGGGEAVLSPILGSDVSVSLRATRPAGTGPVRLTVTATNTSVTPVDSLTVKASVPRGLTVSGGDCPGAAGSASCTMGPVAPGASSSKTIQLSRVSSTFVIGRITATVSAVTPDDVNSGNNSASTGCFVGPGFYVCL